MKRHISTLVGSLIIALAGVVGGLFIYNASINDNNIQYTPLATLKPYNCEKEIQFKPFYAITVKKDLPNFVIKSFGKDKNFIDCFQVVNASTTIGYFLTAPDAQKGRENLGLFVGEFSAENIFNSEDYNFDGYNDLSVIIERGATGNISSIFYLFNPINQKFEYNQELTDFGISSVDESKKELYVYWNWCAGCHVTYTYKYIDGKLTLLKEIKSDRDSKGGFLETTVIYDKGKTSTTTRIMGPDDN